MKDLIGKKLVTSWKFAQMFLRAYRTPKQKSPWIPRGETDPRPLLYSEKSRVLSFVFFKLKRSRYGVATQLLCRTMQSYDVTIQALAFNTWTSEVSALIRGLRKNNRTSNQSALPLLFNNILTTKSYSDVEGVTEIVFPTQFTFHHQTICDKLVYIVRTWRSRTVVSPVQ